MAMRLILASASPRRRELLAQAGYAFAVEAADLDESLREGEAADAYVRRLAEEKARAVFARHSAEGGEGVVLGADTCVVCDGEILGKPVDAKDAMRMLGMLSGRRHEVLTGVAVATRAGVVSDVETTEVTFSRVAEGELAMYCATDEPLDKAGGYGIQGYAARWIPRIDGCYFNVMGLPIARVVRLIEEAFVSS
jgi:septum formation protein